MHEKECEYTKILILFLVDSCICVSSRTKTRIIRKHFASRSKYFVLICSSQWILKQLSTFKTPFCWKLRVFFCAGLLLETAVTGLEGVVIGLSGSFTLSLKLWKCVLQCLIENCSVSSRLQHTSWYRPWIL